MPSLPDAVARRRTFAIIAHPDAGKTTLTEKLLLFGGAIQMAGAVKARGEQRRARSDWMKVERERGISVTASVMTFDYDGRTFNLLDTPGHEDFSEDTYRTLTAVDSAVMVIDAAKGIEEQTRKLFEVCRLRDVPIATFINKMDREARDPFDLIDEIEQALALDVVPASWPIGMGRGFLGCYDLLNDRLVLIGRSKSGLPAEGATCTGLDDPLLDRMLPADAVAGLRAEVEMVRGLCPAFDLDSYRAGHLTPIYFGSAVNNFGVRELLNGLSRYAPSPRRQPAADGSIAPDDDEVSGFVFKIQANMDPKHRDRIAFLRLCSGHFRRGMKMHHVRSGKTLSIHNPVLFLAQDRELAEEAWAGDIIGVPNHGTLRIGDSLTEGRAIRFTGIPSFAPELLQRVRPDDPMRAKHLGRALTQLAEEGAARVFRSNLGSVWIVGMVGLATFVLGAYLAIFQQDLKGLLAYSTISHLGLVTLLLGLDSPLAAVAAIFHMMNHATFKASLFMAAGLIDHETGTRDMRRLSGLYRLMPITATLAMVAAAAMAGVPLLNGFLSKEMFFAETIAHHVDSVLDDALPYVATLAAMFSVAYSLRFIHDVFFGPPPTDLPRTPHTPPVWMLTPIGLLVLACLVVGIIPAITIGPFLDTAVRAVLGAATPAYSLRVWHGFTLPLLMSVTAMVGGTLLYRALRGYLSIGIDGSPVLRHLKAQRIFDRLMVSLSWRAAKSGAQLLSTRRLQPQLRLLVGVALVAALWPLYRRGLEAGGVAPAAIDPAFALVWLVGIACALGAAYQAKFHRLAALILMGGAGLVTCITFVWLSAPDLALTQLLVEIVTTVLLLLGLRWLPKRDETIWPGAVPAAVRFRRLRDLATAVAVGAGLSIIAYAVMTRPLPDGISGFFVARAYTEGGGTNIVNVILVDFRGFDTLGEITVLAVVALTVYAVLRRFRPAPDSIDRPEQQMAQRARGDEPADDQQGDALADAFLVPALIMRLLFPVIGTAAVYLLMRGHDLPGGGFVAGLTMSVAFILQYMAGGARWVEDRLIILPVIWIGLGLVFAAGTGIAAWLFGYPFLTSAFAYADLPVVGRVPLASALIFDLGVFTLVVGATVLILIALAHQSIRSHRAAKVEAATPEAVRVA